MLKGLDGVTTHEHREWIPILENDQDMTRLAGRSGQDASLNTKLPTRSCSPPRPLHLGRDAGEAERHVEILEFLFETLGRTNIYQLEVPIMALVKIPDEKPHSRAVTKQRPRAFLRDAGIDYEGRAGRCPLVPGAPGRRVLAAYAERSTS